MSDLNREATNSENQTEAGRHLTRRKIAAGGAVTLLAFAGCADSRSEQTDNGPVEENTTPTEAEQALQGFSQKVTEEGITVDSVSYSQDDSVINLTYHSADPASRETVTAEIGTITGEFYNSLSAGLTVDRLDATVLGPEGNEQITWHAEQAWYRDFQNGEITANDLTLRVIETAERKDV